MWTQIQCDENSVHVKRQVKGAFDGAFRNILNQAQQLWASLSTMIVDCIDNNSNGIENSSNGIENSNNGT